MSKMQESTDEWSDCDGDWGNLEEYSESNEINMPKKYAPINYYLYNDIQVDKIMIDRIFDIADTFNTSISEVYHLLTKHNWNFEKAQNDFFKNGKYFLQFERNLSKKTVCMVCFDEIEPNNQLTICNEHIFCIDCWRGYLTSKINDGYVNMCCMDSKCEKQIPRDYIVSIFQQMPTLEKYNRWMRNLFIKHSETLTHCPNAKCDLTICNIGVCDKINCKCGSIFCFKCSEEYHYPATCAIMTKWLKKCNSDSDNALWLMENTKSCPQCDTPIQKNGGCNHMVCNQCKYQFCWLCKRDWNKHGSATGGFYKCNKFIAMQKEGISVPEKYEQTRFLHYYSRYINHKQSKHILEGKIGMIKNMLEKDLTQNMLKSITFINTVKDSIDLILECRETLKNSYPIGYCMDKDSRLELFEYWQSDLEKHCEYLHGLIEVKNICLLWKNKENIFNYYRITKKYHKNLCNDLSNLELKI